MILIELLHTDGKLKLLCLRFVAFKNFDVQEVMENLYFLLTFVIFMRKRVSCNLEWNVVILIPLHLIREFI